MRREEILLVEKTFFCLKRFQLFENSFIKVCKVNNRLQTFEKTSTNKNIMHGLHNMFY